MAYFNTKQKILEPRPIPPIPPYIPPVPPVPETPEEGSTPAIPRDAFTGTTTLRLYHNSSDPNVLSKSLSGGIEFNITFKDVVSAANPSIILDCGNSNISDYNYCYIAYSNRYYYIEDKEYLNGNLWRLVLHTDVLMSFKEQINNLQGILNRTAVTTVSNKDYPDDKYYIEGHQTQILKFNDNVKLKKEGEFIVMTVGPTE